MVEEDGRWRLDDTWYERVLNELEVELLGRIVAEYSAIVRQVNLEIVCDTKSLSKHTLGHQRVNIVIVPGMVTKETWTQWVSAHRGDLKLENHSLLLSGAGPDECLLAMSSYHRNLAPLIIIHPNH